MTAKNERTGLERPPSMAGFRPLEEATWKKWLTKGREGDERTRMLYSAAVKWATLGVLLATVGFWAYAEPYQILIRFAVALGATSTLFQAVRTRHYVFAALFSAVALLFNPLLPALPLAGDWSRWVVFASIIPFAIAPAWLQTARLLPAAGIRPKAA